MEFKGVQEEVIEKAIKKGYAKTKSEAVRMAVLDFGKNLGLIKTDIQDSQKNSAEMERKRNFFRLAGAWKDMDEENAKAVYKGIEMARKSLNRSLATKR